jgi:hypothetical protein
MVNLMTIKKTIAITLLTFGLMFSVHAGATGLGPVISQAYEVSIKDFRAPVTPNGAASFKECDECERMSVRVTNRTRYQVNGRAVRLEDFRKKVSQAGDRGGVTVLHHLESDTIEMINVSF